MPNKRDRLYAEPRDSLAEFSFDERVAAVFPDMIKRSVPGYAHVIGMLGVFAARYVQADSRCYDLGCSLGAATLAMRHRIQHPGVEIIAVDNSAAMLQRFSQMVEAEEAVTPVRTLCRDIREVEIENASFVVLNFTLQFIPPAQRDALLAGIWRGLRPGGALVLSEKICFDEPRQSLFTELHHEFKLANGYSELEIAQKRTALENVLIPESLERHHERLARVGFSQSHTWFQSLNFASLLALK